VQRLIHLVMLLALLLSGPTLPAWAMPCCNGLATKAMVEPAATHADATEAKPSCHHARAHKAAAVQDAMSMQNSHCTHGTCILQHSSPAPAPQATFSADAAATPILAESRLPLLIAGNTAPAQALHPPSSITAMALPLRV
jgi:hypothetical protein